MFDKFRQWLMPWALLVVFPALALLAAPPALAAHFIARETVFQCQDCQLSKPYIDVSRGYPILLGTVGTGENMEDVTGLLMIRPLAQAATAGQGGVSLAGEGSRWTETRIDLGSDTFKYVVTNTGGACGDEMSMAECIGMLYVYINENSQATAQSHQVTLDGSGNITGSQSGGVSLVPGLTGTPSWLDAMITPDGKPHVAWWDQSGLNYAYEEDGTWNTPVPLAGYDEINWPSGFTPPTGMGYFGDENKPIVVTDLSPDGSIDTFTYSIEDPASDPSFALETAPLPEGVETDETTTFEVDQGGDNPGATMTTGEKIVRYQNLNKPKSFVDPRTGTGWEAVTFSQNGRFYEVFLTSDGEVSIHLTNLDKNGDPTEIADVDVCEGYAAANIVGAKIDDNGVIHICLDSFADQKQSYEWIEVTLDENTINWTTLH